MKILSIIDSFKGTFTSLEISHIVKEELEKKGAEVTCIPISDGGEGFLEAYNYINHLEKVYSVPFITDNTAFLSITSDVKIITILINIENIYSALP